MFWYFRKIQIQKWIKRCLWMRCNVSLSFLQWEQYLIYFIRCKHLLCNWLKDISLFFGRPIQNDYQFCHFTFTPNTPTGKAAKYPYTMFFNCKNGNITFTGKIEYISNNTMGKISITIFDSKNTFEIAVAVKNSSLQITRIGQAIFNKQYMTDIFNINKQ